MDNDSTEAKRAKRHAAYIKRRDAQRAENGWTPQAKHGPHSRYADMPRFLDLPSIIRSRLAQCMTGAEARGHSFTLTVTEYIDLSEDCCHYCGSEATTVHRSPGLKGAWLYQGIDRMDNAIGYSAANCVPCCWACNHLKGTVDYDQFLEQIARIAAHQSKKTL